MKKIEILSRIFWKFVCGPGPKLKPKWFQNTNSSLEKITCGNLFVTAALNEILGKIFQHHPLTVKELLLALRKLTSEVKDDKLIVDGLINVGQKQLNKISTSKTQRKILSVFIEYWSRNAADELSLLLATEIRSLVHHLGASTPHLTAKTYPIWNDLKLLVEISEQHAERLSLLLDRLDLPPPRHQTLLEHPGKERYPIFPGIGRLSRPLSNLGMSWLHRCCRSQ